MALETPSDLSSRDTLDCTLSPAFISGLTLPFVGAGLGIADREVAAQRLDVAWQCQPEQSEQENFIRYEIVASNCLLLHYL
jgi:hypothetical protein